MMGRCYDPSRTDYASYGGAGVIVCDEWHSFDRFAADVSEIHGNDIPGWHLDKDVIGDGTLYAKDFCCFLPSVLNKLFVKSNGARGCYFDTSRNLWLAQINIDGKKTGLGRYERIEDAAEAYNKAKKENILRMAEMYKEVLALNVYVALTSM